MSAGPNEQTHSAEHHRHPEDAHRAAQLESHAAAKRGQDQRSGHSPARSGAASSSETEARKILPAGYSIDYTGTSRQLRTEGNKFAGAFLLAVALIFLVLAAQFNSFRDPLIILAGSVPLAMFGAMIFVFLKMPAPMPFFTDEWTTSFNIYSQVGLVTLIGLISKNGILIVEFANHLQQQGLNKVESRRGRGQDPFSPGADDDDRDGVRSLPAYARDRRRRGGA